MKVAFSCPLLGALNAWSKSWYSCTPESAFLASLQQLLADLGRTSRSTEKVQVIKRQEQLWDFLRFYAQSRPFNITSRSLDKSIPLELSDSTPPDTLQSLLEALSQREVTGHRAIARFQRYIKQNPEYKELLYSLLDRDWKVGVGPALLSKALCKSPSDSSILVSTELPNARHIEARNQHAPPNGKRPFPITSKDLPIALGYPIQNVKLLSPKEGEHWLISRKLDGIRCLGHYQQGSITMLTRAGNEIKSLPQVRSELQVLADQIASQHPEMADFYLDGELCVLKAPIGGQSPLPADLTEDFRTTLSVVLSKSDLSLPTSSQRQVVFFAFDLFDQQSMADINLSTRLERLENCRAQVCRPLGSIQVLSQHRTNNPLDFRRFLNQQRQQQWEGLILRRDAPFVPKRSRDIIKIKDFFEAEFSIIDWRTDRMAVIVEGRHEVEELLSAIKIKFDGTTEVWVGSGFSLEERRKYAREPHLLQKALVTVRYFQESHSKKREALLKSLRFPTIKAIYESGTRPA